MKSSTFDLGSPRARALSENRKRRFATPETKRSLGTSNQYNDFWDCMAEQCLGIIGFFSRLRRSSAAMTFSTRKEAFTEVIINTETAPETSLAPRVGEKALLEIS